jgi:hypothetical protein
MKTLRELCRYRYKPKISIKENPKHRNRRTHHQVGKTLKLMVNRIPNYSNYGSKAPINWDAFQPKMPPIETYYVPRKKCTTKTQPPSKSKF